MVFQASPTLCHQDVSAWVKAQYRRRRMWRRGQKTGDTAFLSMACGGAGGWCDPWAASGHCLALLQALKKRTPAPGCSLCLLLLRA